MKSILGMMLNEALNEGTSAIRKFKQFEKKTPEWAKNIKKDAGSFEIQQYAIYDLATYYGYDTDKYHMYMSKSIRDTLPNMCNQYLNEFIDEEKVPLNVMLWMIEDIFHNQAKKIKETDFIKLANYLNNEIHWTAPK